MKVLARDYLWWAGPAYGILLCMVFGAGVFLSELQHMSHGMSFGGDPPQWFWLLWLVLLPLAYVPIRLVRKGRTLEDQEQQGLIEGTRPNR